MQKKLPVILDRLIKIFFVWLLVQFFLQTFVTFKLWWDGWIWKIIWLWKEIIILLFILIVGWWVFVTIKNKGFKNFYEQLRKNPIFNFWIYFLITLIISFILAVLVQKVGLGTYILTVKYDLLGFLIFLLWVWLVWYTPLSQKYDNLYQ